MNSGAEDGWDPKFDGMEISQEGSMVHFICEGWGIRSGRYSSDIRKARKDRYEWILEFYTKYGGKGKLSFHFMGVDDYKIYFSDGDREYVLGDGFEYEFLGGSGERRRFLIEAVRVTGAVVSTEGEGAGIGTKGSKGVF